jgi:hypothetical protein
VRELSEEAEAEAARLEEERLRLEREAKEREMKRLQEEDLQMPDEGPPGAEAAEGQSKEPHPRLDGIMFYQPMAFGPDISYDPFDPAYYQWHGHQDAASSRQQRRRPLAALVGRGGGPPALTEQGRHQDLPRPPPELHQGLPQAAPRLRDHQGALALPLRRRG